MLAAAAVVAARPAAVVGVVGALLAGVGVGGAA